MERAAKLEEQIQSFQEKIQKDTEKFIGERNEMDEEMRQSTIQHNAL